MKNSTHIKINATILLLITALSIGGDMSDTNVIKNAIMFATVFLLFALGRIADAIELGQKENK